MNSIPMIETDGRSVREWIGKTPDSAPPGRVRLRIFNRAKGRCHISGRVIRPGDRWEAEHIVALANGGENREKNLAPAMVAPHKIKTKADRKIKKRTDARRRKHIGIRKPRTITRWRKFNGDIVIAERNR